MSTSAPVRRFVPARGPHAAFLNALLAYTDGDDWGDAPIHVGDRLEVDRDGMEDVLVVDMVDGRPVVEHAGERIQLTEDDYAYIIASPYAESLWEDRQEAGAPDGVAWGDHLVPDELQRRLLAQFDALCADPPDHHPGSGTAVRDLIHPSLYPYVAGVTPIHGREDAPEIAAQPAIDRWGRPFESSRFQWLPTDVDVDADGRASFVGYVNNLDDERHPEVRGALEELFGVALPLLESVYAYAQAFDPWDERAGDHEGETPTVSSQRAPGDPLSPLALRGRRLQVIPKLVQYEIDAANPFEGVWHVEGMSHEHIVATALFVLSRDENLDGGALRFKRGYTREEVGQLFWNINQIRPAPVDEMVTRAMLPLGTLETPAGRTIVFPNSHVHKLTPMTSVSGELATRRIAVFWLVDPEVRILSTSDVPKQQGVLSHERALAHRLELMEERRRHKQSHNVREISLCEH